jgi:hypothetical protein
MTLTWITGAAPRRARWRELTGAHTDAMGALSAGAFCRSPGQCAVLAEPAADFASSPRHGTQNVLSAGPARQAQPSGSPYRTAPAMSAVMIAEVAVALKVLLPELLFQ